VEADFKSNSFNDFLLLETATVVLGSQFQNVSKRFFLGFGFRFILSLFPFIRRQVSSSRILQPSCLNHCFVLFLFCFVKTSDCCDLYLRVWLRTVNVCYLLQDNILTEHIVFSMRHDTQSGYSLFFRMICKLMHIFSMINTKTTAISLNTLYRAEQYK
jgi:hypothetical protein